MGPVVFLLFISLLLPAHDVTEGNVDTSLDTIRSHSLLQFRIHLVLLSSESGSLKGRVMQQPGNRPGSEGVSVNDSEVISLDLSLSEVKAAHAAGSLCGNTHCGRAHMQSIPQLRSLFHLRPRPAVPARRVEPLREKARTGPRHG